jgi:hypothetical protein
MTGPLPLLFLLAAASPAPRPLAIGDIYSLGEVAAETLERGVQPLALHRERARVVVGLAVDEIDLAGFASRVSQRRCSTCPGRRASR